MKYYFFVFLFLFILIFSPKQVFAGSPFNTITTDFSITLTRPSNGGQTLKPTTVSGSYDSSRVNPAYTHICMIPFIDAASWSAGGVSHLVAVMGADFTNQNFYFNPAFVCKPRPTNNIGNFSYNITLPLGAHQVGIFAMALNLSPSYCGAGANAPCYRLDTGYNQSLGPISFTVVANLPAATPPTANIDVPTTDQTITAGSDVLFYGRGTTDLQNWITNYEWNRDGCNSGSNISTVSSFSYPQPSVGSHLIYLRVKSSNGLWSTNCPSRTITVNPGCPAFGTLLSTYCNGYNQTGVYANSACGSYENVIEWNSPSCGYVPVCEVEQIFSDGFGNQTITPKTLYVGDPPYAVRQYSPKYSFSCTGVRGGYCVVGSMDTLGNTTVTCSSTYVAPVNGGWSSWDLDCATTCGVSKTRTCNNPVPSNNGTECQRTNLSFTTPDNRTESIPCPACNTAPNSPSVTGPASGNPDSSYTFTITSTDPEGDQVRYGVDWDKNGVADEWVPAGTATVPSGTALTASHSWSTTGVKQFQVLAQDAPGLNSGWTQKSISLVSQCADTIDNEGDGWADIADPDCHTDGNYSNPTSYDPSRNETGGIASSCNDHVNNNSSALIDCADPVCHTDNNLASACDVTRGEGLHSFTAILRAERNGRVISNKLIPQGSSFDLVWTTTGTPTGCTLKDQRGRNIISNTLNVNYLNRDNVEKIASSRHTVSEGVRENTTFTFSCTVNNAIKATVNVRASTVRAF